jgi:ubiquitin-protein ligase
MSKDPRTVLSMTFFGNASYASSHICARSESGIFEMLMTFPNDYPMSPPTLKFVSEFWHPNGSLLRLLIAHAPAVYTDGRVCISILHPPGRDEMSGERPEERWLPTQGVTSVVLSVMSMFADPNFSSPANVDASVRIPHFSLDLQALLIRIDRLNAGEIQPLTKLASGHLLRRYFYIALLN